MFVSRSGVIGTLVVKLLFLRKSSFLNTRKVSRVLLATDSEKPTQNINFRSKTGKIFKKPEIFEKSDFLPELVLVPEKESQSPSSAV